MTFSMNKIGVTHAMVGDYDLAQSWFEKCVKIYQKQGDLKSVVKIELEVEERDISKLLTE